MCTQIGIEFIKHIETLPTNLEIGRMVPEFNEKNIRELIHPPFRIVYLNEEKAIHVIQVWRSERLLNLTNTPINEKNITQALGLQIISLQLWGVSLQTKKTIIMNIAFF